MIKFWDRLQLMLYVLGFNLVSNLAPAIGLLGFGLMLVLWIIFWRWIDVTFVSVSYIKEKLEKAGENDNKDSSSSNT